VHGAFFVAQRALEAGGVAFYNRVMHTNKTVGLIVPCYNEGESVEHTQTRLRQVAESLPQYRFTYLWVDDGSTDDTLIHLSALAAASAEVQVLSLARNVGQQRAITAGLDHCDADYVVVLDADLQDPPELIPQMLMRLEEGFDVVHGVRTDRTVDSFTKRLTAKFFYAFMRRWVLPELRENAGEFKAFSRPVLLALRQNRERVRFLRGLCATVGFSQTELPYARAPRHAGRSKFPLKQMLRLARDAVFSNTVLPLRLGLYLGLLLLTSAGVYGIAALLAHLGGDGLASPLLHLVLVLNVMGFALTFILLGLAGEYFKIIILEVKQRPLYIVRRAINLPSTDQERPAEDFHADKLL
jgi:dolichol-phosphate mannosyltransferase